MRTFLAVELSDAVRSQVSQLIAQLARHPAPVKWVASENLHLTLKFFGEVRDDDVSRICAIVDRVVTPLPAFDCHFHGVGAFPNLGRPRTIWIGLGEGREPMVRLQKATDRALTELRIPRERRGFHPHLTIGRVRGGQGLGELSGQLGEQAERSFSTMTTSTVTLFSSQLRPDGPVYTALARFELGGSDG
jgi:2'-5' RNA ligase